MGVERFEDLEAWRRARELTREIYLATSGGGFARDFGLRDQIQRAAVSVMSNLAEGFERDSPRDNHRFVCIAKGSAAEVRAQLYVASDVGYLDDDTFGRLHDLTLHVSRLIGGYRRSLQRRL